MTQWGTWSSCPWSPPWSLEWMKGYRVSHIEMCLIKWLADRNIQAKFCLKVVLESWDYIFLGITTSFDKSNIGWPQQPLTVKVWDISEKLDFWWSILQKGTVIGHLGASDNQIIMISNFFDEMRLLRSLRPLRLLRP